MTFDLLKKQFSSWEASSKAVLNPHSQHSNRSENSMLLINFPARYSAAFSHQWAGYSYFQLEKVGTAPNPLAGKEQIRETRYGQLVMRPSAKLRTGLQALSPCLHYSSSCTGSKYWHTALIIYRGNFLFIAKTFYVSTYQDVCVHMHIDIFFLSNRPALLLICYQNETSVNKESPKVIT